MVAAHYYVDKNTQDNGDHDVHKKGCQYMPTVLNRIYLGLFENRHIAVAPASP